MNLFLLPNILMNDQSIMRRAGSVVILRAIRTSTKFLSPSLKGRNHSEHVSLPL
jgi:hypothetical protein